MFTLGQETVSAHRRLSARPETVAAVLAALSAGAAAIHLGMTPPHAGFSTVEVGAFAAAGCAQVIGAAVLSKPRISRRVLVLVAMLNAWRSPRLGAAP